VTYILGLSPPGGGTVMGRCSECGYHLPNLGQVWPKHIEMHERQRARRTRQHRRNLTRRAARRAMNQMRARRRKAASQ